MNEHPTKPGWYWFKEIATDPWQPKKVELYENMGLIITTDDGNYSKIKIIETWPQQWGAKIEEPK